MTGFQKSSYSIKEVNALVDETLDSEDKSFIFLRSQLRSAKDIYQKGGHVTKIYSDQNYRVLFDNKRSVKNYTDTETPELSDTRPLIDVEEGRLLRSISKLPKTVKYSRNLNTFSGKYKNKQDLLIRNFIKALLNNELNLNREEFKTYKDIVDFINNGFDKKDKIFITENYIAQLKRRGNYVKIPRDNDYDNFIEHVKNTFKDFEVDKLFLNS